MAFQKPTVAPQFADLKAILSQTQIDNTTYQTIQGLIDKLTQLHTFLEKQIAETRAQLEKVIAESTIGGALGPTRGKTGYLHVTAGILDEPVPNKITINGENPQIFFKDEAGAGGQQMIDVVNTTGKLYTRALTDDASGVSKVMQEMDRAGRVKFGGPIHERGRAYEVGQRQGWTAGVSDNVGTGLSVGGQACYYSVVGNTVYFKFHLVNIVLNAPAWYVRFTLPPGFPVIDPDTTYNTWRYSTGAAGFAEIGWFYVSSDGVHMWRPGTASVQIPASTITAQGEGFYYIA